MSAIGEYVHLTAQGYEYVGTSRPHQKSSGTAAAALENQRRYMSKMIKQMGVGSGAYKTVEYIEKRLNELVQKNYSENSVVSNWDANNYTAEQIAQEMSQLSQVNFTNLSVSSVPQPISKISTQNANVQSFRQDLNNTINRLNASLQQLKLQTESQSGLHASTLDKMINSLTNTLEKTYKTTYQKMQNIDYRYTDTQKEQNLIAKVNKIIDVYNQIPLLNNQGNVLLSNIIKEMPEVTYYKVRSSIARAITSKGNMGVRHSQLKHVSKQYKAQLGEVEQQIMSAEGNISIRFTWKRQNRFNARIKYLDSLGSKASFIGIGGESMSLADILDEGSIDFANHYYNIFTEHVDKRSRVIAKYRHDYQKALKILAIYKAFSNKQMQKDQLFIYNTNNQIKVITIQKVLEEILERDHSSLESVQFNDENITKMALLHNEKGKDIQGYERIGNMLADAHSRMIRVALSKSLLT